MKAASNTTATTTNFKDLTTTLQETSAIPGSFKYDSTSDDSSAENETSPELTLSTIEQFLFFTSGLGSSLGYISALSSLVYFEYYYGADSYIFLNLMSYLPLVPISLLQARYDKVFDAQEGSLRTYLFRGCVGFGLALWGSIQMTCAVWSRWRNNKDSGLGVFLWCTFLEGTGGAILYGTFNQMASFTSYGRAGDQKMKEETSRLKATISAGVQASALVTLVVSLATGFANISKNMSKEPSEEIIKNNTVVYDEVNEYDGYYYAVMNRGNMYEYVFRSDEDDVENHKRFFSFLITVSVLEFICMMGFLWLLYTRPLIAISMSRRDLSIREEDMIVDVDNALEKPLLPSSTVEERIDDGDYYAIQRNTELSYRELWSYSRSTCGVLVLSLVPSFLVGSWFTQVKSNWMGLSQVLFYVRIASDFAGRPATVWCVVPETTRQLTWLATLRLIPVALFFWNATGTLFSFSGLASDITSIFLVSVISFLSGYLVTGCFQVAPKALPEGQNSVTKQASLLTISFAFAAFGGTLLSFIAVGF